MIVAIGFNSYLVRTLVLFKFKYSNYLSRFEAMVGPQLQAHGLRSLQC